MAFWARDVKDDSSGEVSFYCGTVVVEADTREEAEEKFAKRAENWTDQFYSLLTYGPYASEEEVKCTFGISEEE